MIATRLPDPWALYGMDDGIDGHFTVWTTVLI